MHLLLFLDLSLLTALDDALNETNKCKEEDETLKDKAHDHYVLKNYDLHFASPFVWTVQEENHYAKKADCHLIQYVQDIVLYCLKWSEDDQVEQDRTLAPTKHEHLPNMSQMAAEDHYEDHQYSSQHEEEEVESINRL
jgi:hypothetical protein